MSTFGPKHSNALLLAVKPALILNEKIVAVQRVIIEPHSMGLQSGGLYQLSPSCMQRSTLPTTENIIPYKPTAAELTNYFAINEKYVSFIGLIIAPSLEHFFRPLPVSFTLIPCEALEDSQNFRYENDLFKNIRNAIKPLDKQVHSKLDNCLRPVHVEWGKLCDAFNKSIDSFRL